MNEPVVEYTLQNLNKEDIIVVCPRLQMGEYSCNQAREFLREQGLLKRSDKWNLEVNNGKRICFVPDKESSLRGRRNCIFVNIATFEQMLAIEKKRYEDSQKVHGGFQD